MEREEALAIIKEARLVGKVSLTVHEGKPKDVSSGEWVCPYCRKTLLDLVDDGGYCDPHVLLWNQDFFTRAYLLFSLSQRELEDYIFLEEFAV